MIANLEGLKMLNNSWQELPIEPVDTGCTSNLVQEDYLSLVGNQFIYTVDNIEHKYFPDFIIDRQYYEIKGEHMITTDNDVLLDPTHETNKILEMKMKCIKENNIKIIKSKELYNCIKYINQTYGKNYIKQFKNTVN